MKTRCFQVVAVLACTALSSRTSHAGDLVGPGAFDFNLGPSFGVLDANITQFRMEAAFAYCLTPSWRSHIYITAPFGFGFGSSNTVITMMPGVEGDIRLPGSQPIYIYPKAGLGMGLDAGSDSTDIAFGIRFGFGIKYVLNGMWDFHFEPFNMEIYPVGFEGTPILYNLMFGSGVKF